MHRYLNLSLLLCLFANIQPSYAEKFVRDLQYKRYFQRQEEIYQELLLRGIPGARPLSMNQDLAESVIATAPQEIKQAMSCIQHNIICEDDKNIILHGMSGTGKSALAQAIAIKCQIPCLFFNVGTISTEYMNSGVQNLNKIFEYAQTLEKSLGKPCIIIFDELEALTKKHVGANNHENNILISFWQELDKLSNSKIIVVGTMNSTQDVPVQITNRTSMIEIPLPDLQKRKVILPYYLQSKKHKYQIRYEESVTPAYLAYYTEGFSNRDLQKLVAQATKPVILAAALPGTRNRVVTLNDFERVIWQIKKDPKRKLERELGTWKYTLKTHLRDPRILLSGAALTVSMVFTGNTICNQRKAMAEAAKAEAAKKIIAAVAKAEAERKAKSWW